MQTQQDSHTPLRAPPDLVGRPIARCRVDADHLAEDRPLVLDSVVTGQAIAGCEVRELPVLVEPHLEHAVQDELIATLERDDVAGTGALATKAAQRHAFAVPDRRMHAPAEHPERSVAAGVEQVADEFADERFSSIEPVRSLRFRW